MTTSIVTVPAGTTSAVIAVTPTTSVLVGPQVLGGTVSLSFSPNPAGPTANFLPWSFGTSSGPQSFRAGTTGYITVTAATQAATVALSELSAGRPGSPFMSQIVASIPAPLASASSASEQIIASVRVAPGLLPLSGILRFTGNVSMVNNANAKTMQGRIAGVAGTLFYQSGALASNANVNFEAFVALRGDGITQAGFGSGLTNIGLGLGGATAYTSYTTLNYLQNEMEYVITCTKTTAGDLMQMEGFTVELLV